MTRKCDPIKLPKPIQTELERWYDKLKMIGDGRDEKHRRLYFAMVDKVIKLIRPYFVRRVSEYKKKDKYRVDGFQW